MNTTVLNNALLGCTARECAAIAKFLWVLSYGIEDRAGTVARLYDTSGDSDVDNEADRLLELAGDLEVASQYVSHQAVAA